MDQLLSLDNLANKAASFTSTSLYTPQEKERMQELVMMDIDKETAASVYHKIADVVGWPCVDDGSEFPYHPNGESGNDEDAVWEFLDSLPEATFYTLRDYLPEDMQEIWDAEYRHITEENFVETQKIQDTANRRRTDPEVRRFEKFLADGINYMAAYWAENQGKTLAATGPKSPNFFTVQIAVKKEIVDGKAQTNMATTVSSRKKAIFGTG